MRCVELDCFDTTMDAFNLGRKVGQLEHLVQTNWSLYRRLYMDFESAKAALQGQFSSCLGVPDVALSYATISMSKHETRVLSDTLYGGYSLFDTVTLLCSCIAAKLELQDSGMYIRVERFSKYNYTVLLRKR